MPNFVDTFPNVTLNLKITVRASWPESALNANDGGMVRLQSWCASRPTATLGPLGFLLNSNTPDFTAVNQTIIMRYTKFWSGYNGIGPIVEGQPRWDLGPTLRVAVGEHIASDNTEDYTAITSVQYLGRRRGVRLTI